MRREPLRVAFACGCAARLADAYLGPYIHKKQEKKVNWLVFQNQILEAVFIAVSNKVRAKLPLLLGHHFEARHEHSL